MRFKSDFSKFFSVIYVLLLSCLFLASLQGNGRTLGSLVLKVSFFFVSFPYVVSGQMRYLIVSIPDLFLLLNFLALYN